jgi:hypothetical protein
MEPHEGCVREARALLAIEGRYTMSRNRFANLAACWLFSALGACSPDPSGKTLSVDVSERVCQLTGETDWVTGASTTSKSKSAFGLVGTDLGYPVEHKGRMAFFFGVWFAKTLADFEINDIAALSPLFCYNS